MIDETEGPVFVCDGAWIHELAYVAGPCTIHTGAKLYPGVVVGCRAEAYGDDAPMDKPITIAANAVLREHAVVQRGINSSTVVGSGCYIMHGCHIAHDCELEAGVTMAPYVVLGGHTWVGAGANLGIGSKTHQWTVIGAHAMLGMGAVAIGDLPPCDLAVGMPARIRGRNEVGMRRAGLYMKDGREDWGRIGVLRQEYLVARNARPEKARRAEMRTCS